MVHIMLKPGLENFEHYFTSVWDECNCAVVWAFFGIAFFLGQYKKDKNPQRAKDKGYVNNYEKEKLCNIMSPQRDIKTIGFWV